MDREILFRGKRKESGEWVEGGYYRDYSGKEFIIQKNGMWSQKFVEVDPETVCQYTGMTDKSGRRIFEGDICDRKEKFPEIVIYNNGAWTLDYSYVNDRERGYNYCSLGFYVSERGGVEVIGNIFDNSALLECLLG